MHNAVFCWLCKHVITYYTCKDCCTFSFKFTIRMRINLCKDKVKCWDFGCSLFVPFLRSHSHRPWLTYSNKTPTVKLILSTNNTLLHLISICLVARYFATQNITQTLKQFCSCTRTHLHIGWDRHSTAKSHCNSSVNTRTWCQLHLDDDDLPEGNICMSR